MARRSYFTVKGRRYAVATLSSLTFAEGLELERISGMAAQDVPDGFNSMRPGAMLAMYVVSMRRVNPRVTERDILRENLYEIADSLETLEEEDDEPKDEPEGDALPPANGPDGPERNGD